MKQQLTEQPRRYCPPVCHSLEFSTWDYVFASSEITTTQQPVWDYGEEIEEW